ncbi:MAG: hypothetical protein AAFS10_26590, partial [Myxococcota bacterium]
MCRTRALMAWVDQAEQTPPGQNPDELQRRTTPTSPRWAKAHGHGRRHATAWLMLMGALVGCLNACRDTPPSPTPKGSQGPSKAQHPSEAEGVQATATSSSHALTSAPVWSDDQGVDDPISPRVATAQALTSAGVALAQNSTTTLAVWVENRPGEGRGVYGALLRPDGTRV